jgi:hypothetical protein
MNPPRHAEKRSPARFVVGERVRVTRGLPGTEAEILEDRGFSGFPLRRHYFVIVRMDGGSEIPIQLPEEFLAPLDPPPDRS